MPRAPDLSEKASPREAPLQDPSRYQTVGEYVFEKDQEWLRILMGLDAMDEALERRGVKYIVVRARQRDMPDAYRSRAVLEAHPRVVLLFQNSEIMIYGVESP